MSYRNLLLHLDDTKACPGRIDAAVALASQYDAHVTGLYCIGEVHVPGWADWPGDLEERQHAGASEHVERVMKGFRERAEKTGIRYDARTTRVPVEAIGDEISLHARYADLAIVGQVDPDELPAGGRHVPEHVVLGSGRPILVIPYIGPPRKSGEVRFGRNVMVAWDAGREAARAVNDSLPLLKAADQVHLLAVNPAKGPRRHGEEPGADIALHLSRHGVDVEVNHIEAHDLEPADALLARLSDRGSDMLVMGAYGHSRMREFVLGGVTRSILGQMPVPVFMSH